MEKYTKLLEKLFFLSIFFSSSCLLFANISFEDADVDVYYGHDSSHFAVPPPKLMCHEDAIMFFVSGSYTLWRPYQGGMGLLYTYTEEGLAPANWVYPNTNYKSGFKVALGVNTFHDGWKVEAEYCWFYNHPHTTNVGLNSQVDYLAIWAIDLGAVNEFAYNFSNTFNQINLTLDRTFYAGNYFTFAPWIGLIGAWEKQIFNQQIDATDFSIYNQTQNWWGLGPYLGIDSTYYFVDYFGIFLKGGGALNICKHKTSQYKTNDGILDLNTSIKIWDVEPMAEALIGIRLNSFGVDWGLELEVGWDLQLWFNHNGFIILPVTQAAFGNYSMQGLTATLRLEF
jgi:hypothetical protein